MHIIFDFDHTLFHMQAMHEALQKAVCKLGISPEEYKEAYELETHWKVFTVKGFANRLEKATDIAAEKITRAYYDIGDRSSEFVYPDVHSACEELKRQGHSLYLLSWGNHDWQKRKINNSGLAELFDRIMTVTELKSDSLLEIVGMHEDVLVIDDKPAEIRSIIGKHPHVKGLRMRREGAKYSDQPTPGGMKEVRDMHEVVDIVKKQIIEQ